MSTKVEPNSKEAAAPNGFSELRPRLSPVASADTVLLGRRLSPQAQLLTYSPDEWEEFVEEWGHFCLKKQYAAVWRMTGANDRGIDIAGFTDAARLQGVWDTYQCKRYGQALGPATAWPEIGKILWHSFNGHYRPPRQYYFVAPRGVGTALQHLLADAGKLKAGLITAWDKSVRKAITETQEVLLEGDFLTYVECFDFSIFSYRTALELIADHRTHCPLFSARFGGGLPERPSASPPPEEIAEGEHRYVAQLLEAYADHRKELVAEPAALAAWHPLQAHFRRQREAFYRAEALRVFARDHVQEGTFEGLQDDICYGVADVHDGEHPDGYRRVCAVTQAARELQITENALIQRVRPPDRDGICHQLANEDRLTWTHK